MENKTNFVDGIFLEKKSFSNGGEIIKVSINPKFIEYYNANKNDKGYVNIDIKTSKDSSKMYAELNTFKPREVAQVSDSNDDDDLPF